MIDPALGSMIDNLLRIYAPDASWHETNGAIRLVGVGPQVVKLVAGRVKAHGWAVPVEGEAPR